MYLRYVCRECGKINLIDNGFKWFFTPHFGAKKYLKCIWCGRIHTMKRWDGRKWIDWPKEKTKEKEE